jgi:hypothetical protein
MRLSHEHLCVQGDPNQVDSFTACLAAVLNAWDLSVTYDWVAGLAGTAFSPVLDPGEDCMAWWMEAGSDARICFLGHALGFTAERVTRDSVWDDAAREAFESTGLLPQPHETHFARLRAAFDRGDAVLLRTWPTWSVLVGWARDLDDLPFATVPGFERFVAEVWGPAQAQVAYLLNPMTGDLGLEEAVHNALRYGAHVAGGNGKQSGLRYGSALYKAAAERMTDAAFCAACGDGSDGCVHRTLLRMLGTQRSAVGFLSEARAIVGGGLPWDVAVEAFMTMVDVTCRYAEWPAFQAAWPSETFRRRVADDLRTLGVLQTRAAEVLGELAMAFEREIVG